MVHVKIPATTANFGPGFDCVGMALRLYNHVWAEKTEGGLVIETNTDGAPADEANLVYRSIARFYEETGGRLYFGLRLIQKDNIPMTRGLGSSAACVAAGLCAANALSGRGLSRSDLALMAARIEGHPDNAAPAILGGLVVGAMGEDGLRCVSLGAKYLDGLRFAAIIPDFTLATETARCVLPKEIPVGDAVFNISRAALLIAALAEKDYGKLAEAARDKIHQPSRTPLVPDMEEILGKAVGLGAYSAFLSGAGPTLIAIYDEGNRQFEEALRGFLSGLSRKWVLTSLKADYEGVVVEND
ncbi:MAG: homoserine kinase [Clostridiales bacterium]|jgi:homoserine kinase|nr:homoserine kinase [Clostridiales bacterium]